MERLHSPPSLLLIIVGVFLRLLFLWDYFFLPFFLSLWGVFLLLLYLWDCESREIFISAAYFGGLCFFGHSSVCHS